MILDEFVDVKWNGVNKAYYVSLGYTFTKVKAVLKVRPVDLPKNSNVKVNLKCDTCGTVYVLPWVKYIKKQNKHECVRCYKLSVKTWEFVCHEFAKRGYTLLTQHYINSDQYLEYRCGNHTQYVQKVIFKSFNRGHGCVYCSREKNGLKRRIKEDDVFKVLYALNYEFYEFVLDGKPLGNTTKVKYICPNHPFDVQVTNYHNLQTGARCPMCCVDRKRYKFSPNKFTTISDYFRKYVVEWKELTEKLYNYQCLLTGDDKYAVHHHTPFDKILKEALINVNLPIHKVAKYYTETELITIITELKRLHEVYGPGVCLSDVLHKKLHSRYGQKTEITKEQFEEFCALYHAGEILEKNKNLNFD